ncbi:MAG: ATP-dependent DNA helicase [Saprospiraceae bacterium]|nr:ATP-dependent DNA helicase [Saprospiraceae bacterium]
MDTSKKQTLEQYNRAFLAAKATLNEKQKKAVDAIYGPVMAVAGPGTGKTQLLAVRIGNILQQTDINTRNILCLTYTEAGSMAMRDRLKRFIGPEAYNASIFTFHSFCNFVIQENIQFFGGFRNLQLVSDLELVDVYREIIDGFAEDHPLKRLKGNIYYESTRLKYLFNTMKQEGWSPQVIEQNVLALQEYYNELDENGSFKHPKYVCKAKQTGKLTGKVYTKGEVNQDKVQIEINSFDGLIAAAHEMEVYDSILRRLERYDYNDMILWVINAFKEHDELLAKYQERFQFLMVDEYQDTNGAQNELLFLLADNPVDDKPNVFIVGDDDQSIYRFQGANMNNIIEFADKYNPIEIVLDNNYRSDQRILDSAKKLIENNGERLVNFRTHLTKKLVESLKFEKRANEAIRIHQFKNVAQEEIGIINDILKKQKEGVPLNEIAVIYRKHRNVENMVKYLSLMDIPLNIKRKVNVLKEQEIKRLILILKYISEEYQKPFSADKYLFEILHFDFFGISAQDAALISLYCSNRSMEEEEPRRWRTVLSDVKSLKDAGISDVDKIIRCSDALESWIHDIPNVTAQILFERILTKGGVLDDILSSEDKVWRLQLVNTFFNFIKEESAREENISMIQILDMVAKMEENSIEMPLNKIVYAENGIHFLTAHGSKGLEFDHVYIIRSDNQNWVQKNYGRSGYKYPAALVPASEQSDVEDDRRLFYVAITRAKSHLTLSFSDFNDNEKALEPARFISEITEKEEDVKRVEVNEDAVTEYKATLMRYSQGQPVLIEHDLIDNVLQSFKVSATSLNKYLRCPITFYFENILRVPMARSMANGFGNAIHYALELYFRDMEADPERKVPPVENVQQHFMAGMKKYHSHFTSKERELSEIRGKKLLAEYYREYHSYWHVPRKFELEFDIKTEYNNVPISGKLDQVSIFDNHLEVIDYKTGRYISSKLKGPVGDDDPGGDYWRQIVFYKLLLSGDDRLKQPMKAGIMDFVEMTKEGKFYRRKYEVEPFEMDIVGEQLTDTYAKIKKHEFTTGCEEENCKWCNFVNENMSVDSLIEEDE